MPGLREVFSGNGTHRKRDAAIGAAAGSFLGPIGTIAGGALGGWFGGRSDSKVPTINSGNVSAPNLNLLGTSLPQMSMSTPPVTFGGTPPPATSTLGAPVNTAGLPMPSAPNVAAPVPSAPQTSAPVPTMGGTPFTPMGNGLFDDKFGGQTYSATPQENKQYGYWGSGMANIEDHLGGASGGAMTLANRQPVEGKRPMSIL